MICEAQYKIKMWGPCSKLKTGTAPWAGRSKPGTCVTAQMACPHSQPCIDCLSFGNSQSIGEFIQQDPIEIEGLFNYFKHGDKKQENVKYWHR